MTGKGRKKAKKNRVAKLCDPFSAECKRWQKAVKKFFNIFSAMQSDSD